MYKAIVFFVTSSRHGGRGGGIQLQSFATSAPDGGKCPSTRPGHLEIGKEHGTGGWKSWSGHFGDKKTLLTRPGFEPWTV